MESQTTVILASKIPLHHIIFFPISKVSRLEFSLQVSHICKIENQAIRYLTKKIILKIKLTLCFFLYCVINMQYPLTQTQLPLKPTLVDTYVMFVYTCTLFCCQKKMLYIILTHKIVVAFHKKWLFYICKKNLYKKSIHVVHA